MAFYCCNTCQWRRFAFFMFILSLFLALVGVLLIALGGTIITSNNATAYYIPGACLIVFGVILFGIGLGCRKIKETKICVGRVCTC